jgi:hypothetical protein
MKVTFQWSGPQPQGEDITTIEANIENEISHFLDGKAEESEELLIVLAHDLLNSSLAGSGGTKSKRVAVTFNYSLHSGHLANYQYHS